MQRVGHPSDEEIAAWLADGAADPALGTHIQQCPACQGVVSEFWAIERSLHTLPAPPLPRSFTLTRDELVRLRPEPWYRAWQRVLRRVALATATAFAVLLFAGVSLALLLPPVALATPTAAAAPRVLQAQAIESTVSTTPAAEQTRNIAQAITFASTPAPATSGQASASPVAAPTASVTIRPTPLLYDVRWHLSLLTLGIVSVLSLGASLILPALARRGQG